MAIFLPGTADDQALALDEMTPREIVASWTSMWWAGRGQARGGDCAEDRMRRQKLSPELAEDIMPKNIIMIGPTGVGKTRLRGGWPS